MKKKQQKSVWDIVKEYPTKYKEGFTSIEVALLLLKHFPEVEIKQFYDKLGVHTAALIDGQSVTYHSDVELGIRCCLEKRDPNLFEFD